jgi:hypothetical protein
METMYITVSYLFQRQTNARTGYLKDLRLRPRV